MPKEKYPGIPSVSDEKNLVPTVRALVEVVELLIGQRGSGNLRAATKQELAKVGVVLPETRNGG